MVTTNLFEFAEFYDITDFAQKQEPKYKQNNYIKIYICVDTNTIWLCRVLKDINEDYETQQGVFLLERDNIDKYDYINCQFISCTGTPKGGHLTIDKLKEILENDDFENWDTAQYDSLEELENDLEVKQINLL